MTEVSSVILTPQEEADLAAWVKAGLEPKLKDGAWFRGQLHGVLHHFKVMRLENPRITVEQYAAGFPPREWK